MSIEAGDEGFALPFAVGMLAILAAFVSLLILEAREYKRSTTAALLAFRAQQAADGAIYRTAFALANPGDAFRPPLDGVPTEIEVGGVRVNVRVASESGKIDLNRASGETLAALFRALGAPEGEAEELARHTTAWRRTNSQVEARERAAYAAAGRSYAPRFGAFSSTSELNLVLGMSSSLSASLPYAATVWSRDGSVDRALAPKPVLDALASGGDSFARTELEARAGEKSRRPIWSVAPGDVVTIEASVPAPGGALARRALVTLRWDRGRPFSLLWLR